MVWWRLIVLYVTIFPLYRADNLELLLGTLRTHQQAACDQQTLTIACPPGTTISIEVAQYGAAPSRDACASELTQYQPVAVEVVGGTECTWNSNAQYSLLQTVVEACQKKRQCKFSSPAALVCPGVRRYVELAYKCRPYEFRSRVGCENDVLHLSCNPHSRVAIYSAQYGRTEYDSIQCPQPRGVKEETCLEPYATETAMRECHGKRRCVLVADSSMFGKPCGAASRTYLKVVYTCVPRSVLKQRYETAPEEDEVGADGTELGHDDGGESNQQWSDEVVPPAPAVAASSPRPPHHNTNHTQLPSASPPRHHAADHDQLNMVVVYVVTALGCVLLIVGIVCCVSCIVSNRRTLTQPADKTCTNTDIPNGFTDSISDVDNDINITSLTETPVCQHTDTHNNSSQYVGRAVPNTFPHLPNDMYGPMATLPRMHAETDPNRRTLCRYSNAQYYFP